MGANNSKPSGQNSEHVFTGTTPVQFSQEIIDSLQSSPETDSTREKALESHIQSRVHRELLALQEKEAAALAALQDSLSSPEVNPAHGKAVTVTSLTVAKGIEILREKLAQRKKVVEEDEGVQKAKGELIRCLREHDRRPLDCWREVEAFRREVGRLEGMWVERVVG